MHWFEDCFTKRYANFYSHETVKEKTRQVKKEVFLWKFRFYKCTNNSSWWWSSKSVTSKDIKMKIMIKHDINIKHKGKVEILDRFGEICDVLMVQWNPIYHWDLLCDPCKFGNLSINLVDYDG